MIFESQNALIYNGLVMDFVMISQILKYVTTMEEIVVDTMSILKIAKSVNVLILMKVQNFAIKEPLFWSARHS